MTTFNEGMAWAKSTRVTYLALGDDPQSLDMTLVPIIRESGSIEKIPLIAIEHCRLNAVYQSCHMDARQKFDLLAMMDEAGHKLLAAGWSHLQLTANALNKTVERAKESVDAGFYSVRYGIPTDLYTTT